MSSIRVALAQILSGADPQANLALVEEGARAAKAQGAQLVVFPEATMRRFGEPLSPVAEPVGGPWPAKVRELAAELGLAIVVGMFSPARDGRVRNTLLATNGPGLWHYDKIHLFDALGFVESRAVEAGDQLVIFEAGPAKIGLTACYDVRFPWLYQELARQGADILVVSASWGSGPRKAEQWRLLTSARALDSTSFVLACGQADPETTRGAGAAHEGQRQLDQGQNQRRSGAAEHRPGPAAPNGIGFSRVVSPFGETLQEAGSAPELLVVELDLDLVGQARAALPVLDGSAGAQGFAANTGKVLRR